MLNEWVFQLVSLLRYPISSPHDVLLALGMESDFSDMEFRHFLKKIVTRIPRRIYRDMSRDEAERSFSTAYKKEVFHTTTHASFCFVQGWLEFVLEFDRARHLKRLYVHHPLLSGAQSIELELPDHQSGVGGLEVCAALPERKRRKSMFSSILSRFRKKAL